MYSTQAAHVREYKRGGPDDCKAYIVFDSSPYLAVMFS